MSIIKNKQYHILLSACAKYIEALSAVSEAESLKGSIPLSNYRTYLVSCDSDRRKAHENLLAAYRSYTFTTGEYIEWVNPHDRYAVADLAVRLCENQQ